MAAMLRGTSLHFDRVKHSICTDIIGCCKNIQALNVVQITKTCKSFCHHFVIILSH